METNLTANQTNELLDTWKGKVTEDQLLDALSYALNKLEIDPEISRQAYHMRLENVITSDEYNPTTRTLKSARRGDNSRVTNNEWVNHIPAHGKPTCMMIVDDIFEMLESGTSLDDTWGNPIQSRIIELFINLRSFNLDIEHFDKIRYYILKTLDSYGQVDLMLKVSKFDS